MRKWVRVLMAACLYYSGLVKFSRWLMQRSGRRLIILNYHSASHGDLRSHMLYLRRHYRMLHLEEALEELYTSYGDLKRKHDRRTSLVLTFDDGYSDNYGKAFALARELKIPITIFLIPGYVESGQPFWWTEGTRLVRLARSNEIVLEGRKYDLTQAEERVFLSKYIDEHLRYTESVADRETFLVALRQALAIPPSERVEGKTDRSLTWEEVHQMQESGWVSFGAHTMHHPILAYLKDSAEVRFEIEECRKVMEEHLGCHVRTFAYPVGRAEHIGPDALQAVKDAGYMWAVTTVHGVNTPHSDPHRLGRVLGGVNRHWLLMAAETSGIWHFFSPLWKSFIGEGDS